MLLDCILLCLVIAFAWIGARRGALTTGTRVVALLLAYGGAIVSAQQWAEPLARRLAIVEFYAAPAAAIFGFIVTFCLASLLGMLLRGWDAARLGGGSRGALDRAIGGLLGGLRGGLVVLLLCWLAIGLDAARDVAVLRPVQLEPARTVGGFGRHIFRRSCRRRVITERQSQLTRRAGDFQFSFRMSERLHTNGSQNQRRGQRSAEQFL